MEYILTVFANLESNPLPALETERTQVELSQHGLVEKKELHFYPLDRDKIGNLTNAINLYQNNITWFHFSGHHDLGLQLDDGFLTSLFENLEQCPNLKGVFINGCSSQSTVERFKGVVPFYMGTSKPIYDGVARDFSIGFYKGLKSIDDWNDYDHLHTIFNLAKLNTIDALNANSISDTKRGGGEIYDFEKEFYLVSEKDEANRQLFENKKNNYYENLIESIDPQKDLIDLIISLNSNPRTYSDEVPFIFSHYIRALDIDRKRPRAYTDNRVFGQTRTNLISDYFYTYLNFCKYSILSILWEEINNEKIIYDRKDILELINPAEQFADDNIQTLKKLCEEALLVHGTEDEKKFINELLPSFRVLKKGVALFNNTSHQFSNSAKYFYDSENLLKTLISVSQVFNKYHLRSVYSKYYYKYRSDEQEAFLIEYRGRQSKDLIPESDMGFSIAHIHSIYLCLIESEKGLNINLSPFYFDKNSSYPLAKRIEIYYLDEINRKTKDFEYYGIYDPVHDEETVNRWISVNANGITDRSNPTNSSAEEIRKSKRIYDQLSHFFEKLSK